MNIKFEKYHGAGNDFIIIDSKDLANPIEAKQIELLCHRRFGIGADGVMIIKESQTHDFEMQYFNSDGYEGSMCGNGGRCIAHYANRYKYAKKKMTFLAIDGIHHAEIVNETVLLGMNDVSNIIEYKDGLFIDTGSPHFVKFVDNIDKIDVFSEGKYLADDKRFAPARTNVNFIEFNVNLSKIATFERGVEAETLSCGTGSVAAAIGISHKLLNNNSKINLSAKGGNLSVSFDKIENTYKNIKLSGPTKFVFSGQIDLAK
jgi:diaminopimelate epimerase